MSRFLASWEQYVQKTTDAPPDFIHAAGLACLSTIALGRRWIRRGSDIRPNVYLMLVAGSSRDRKSTCVDLSMDMLRAVCPERIAPEDFTAEGLISYMRTRPGKKSRTKLIIPMAEFGTYLAQALSYGATASATLCKLYDGQSFERVRSGKRPLSVENPRVSLFGGCAYGMFERYASPLDWVTGLFARFLFISPLTRRAEFTIQPPKATQEEERARACLVQLQADIKDARCAMPVRPEAEEILRAFAKTVSLGNEDADMATQAQRERLVNSTWKLALLYQLDINPGDHIGAQAMEAAVSFAQKAWASFSRIYISISGDETTRVAKRIWQTVTEAGPSGISRSALLRKFHLHASRFQSVIDLLVKNGAVGLRKEENPGRTREVCFILDPLESTKP